MQMLHDVGPYDLRDAENMDTITESSHNNKTDCIMCDVIEFVTFCIKKSKVGHNTEFHGG